MLAGAASAPLKPVLRPDHPMAHVPGSRWCAKRSVHFLGMPCSETPVLDAFKGLCYFAALGPVLGCLSIVSLVFVPIIAHGIASNTLTV